MVKRYYIQDYSEIFRGNTEIKTIASDFIRPSIESSLTRRGKKTQHIKHVVRAGGFLQVVNLNKVRKQQCRYQKKYLEAFHIFPCYIYDDVFMLFLLLALSQVATHTTHTIAHINKQTKKLAQPLASQLQYIQATVGNRPRNSKKQKHRRHKRLSLAKYRLLNRLGNRRICPAKLKRD